MVCFINIMPKVDDSPERNSLHTPSCAWRRKRVIWRKINVKLNTFRANLIYWVEPVTTIHYTFNYVEYVCVYQIYMLHLTCRHIEIKSFTFYEDILNLSISCWFHANRLNRWTISFTKVNCDELCRISSNRSSR